MHALTYSHDDGLNRPPQKFVWAGHVNLDRLGYLGSVIFQLNKFAFGPYLLGVLPVYPTSLSKKSSQGC